MSTQTTLFAPLGVETAPEKSRPLLEKIQKSFKFIPNLFGVFANSPVLLEGYLGLEGAFEKGSLSAVERQIVLLAASVENSCRYCTAAHSTVLKAFLHVPAEVVSAVRSNVPCVRSEARSTCRAHEGDRFSTRTCGSADDRELPGRRIP